MLQPDKLKRLNDNATQMANAGSSQEDILAMKDAFIKQFGNETPLKKKEPSQLVLEKKPSELSTQPTPQQPSSATGKPTKQSVSGTSNGVPKPSKTVISIQDYKAQRASKEFSSINKKTDEDKISASKEVSDEFNDVGIVNKAATLAKSAWNSAADVFTAIGSLGSETKAPEVFKANVNRATPYIQKAKDEYVQKVKLYNQQVITNKSAVKPVYNYEDIKKRAFEIAVDEKASQKKTDRVNSYMENLDPEVQETILKKTSQEYKSTTPEIQKLFKSKSLAEQAALNSQNQLNELNTVINSYKSKGQIVPQDVVNNMQIAIKENEDNHKDAIELNDKYSDLESKRGDLKNNIRLFDKNYDFLTNTLLNTTAATLRLASGVYGGIDYVNHVQDVIARKVYGYNPALAANLRIKQAAGLSEKAVSSTISKLEEKAETPSSASENFGRYVVNEVIAKNAPMMASLAVGGGVGMGALVLGSAGESYTGMQKEMEEGKQYSDAQTAFIPLANAAVDAALFAFDAQLLKGAQRTIKSATQSEMNVMAKSALDQLLSKPSTYKEVGKKVVKKQLHGLAMMDGTIIAKNVIARVGGVDPNRDLLEGTKDASAISLVLVGIMDTAPHLVAKAISEVSLDNRGLKASNNVLSLEKQLSDPLLSADAKAIVEKQHSKAVDNLNSIVKKQIADVSSLSEKQYKEVLYRNNEINKLKEEAIKIKTDENLTPELQKQMLDSLADSYSEAVNRKKELLNNGAKAQFERLDIEEQNALKEEANKVLNKEFNEDGTREYKPTEDEVVKKAISIKNEEDLKAKEEPKVEQPEVKPIEVIAPEIKAEPVVTEVESIEEIKFSGQKVSDVINRPATLESFGGSKLEKPIEGDLYQEGQRIIFEDKNNKTYDLGGIEELDKNAEEIGLKPQESKIEVSSDGKVIVDGNEWNMQMELPTKGIEYDKNGNITKVSLKDNNGKTKMWDGQIAEDIGYNILLKDMENPENAKEIDKILKEDEKHQNRVTEIKNASEKRTNTSNEPNIEEIKPTSKGKEIVKKPISRVIDFNDPEKIKGYKPNEIMHFKQGVDNNTITLITDPLVKKEYSEQRKKAGIFGSGTSHFKHILKDIAKSFRDSYGNDKIIDLRGLDLNKQLSEILKDIHKTTEIETEKTIETTKRVDEVKDIKDGGEVQEGVEKVGITKENLKELEKDYELELSKRRDKISDEELAIMAKNLIESGYNIDGLVKKSLADEKYVPTDLELNILAEYAADMKGKIDSNSSDADIAKYRDILSAINRGTSEAGRALRMAKVKKDVIDSIADVMSDMMDDYNVDSLTKEQRVDAEARFKIIEKSLNEHKEALDKVTAELERLKAEKAVNGLSSKEKRDALAKSSKTSQEYSAERKEIVKNIKDKWNKVAKGGGPITAVPIPFSQQIAAIAPDVAKLISSYLEQGVAVTLDEVRSLLKKDIQDAGIDITDNEVNRLIAGEGVAKKESKNELMRQKYEIQQEQKLLIELEKLERGEQQPKTERKKVEKNQRLTELRAKIKELTGEDLDEKFIQTARQRIKTNEAKANNINEKIKAGDFSKEQKPQSVLDIELLQKNNKELYEDYLKSVEDKHEAMYNYELSRQADKIKNENALNKINRYADIAINTSKGTVAMFDQSYFLVQMLPFTLSNPLKAVKFAKQALARDFINAQKFKRDMTILHESPLYDLIKKTELAILEPRSFESELRSELHGGEKNLWNKEFEFKGKKYSVGQAFERSTTSFMNNARLSLFNNGVEKLYQSGKTFENAPEEFKSLARAINELTGQGKVQKQVQMASPIVNKIIWSPKMFASTLNILGLGDIIRPVETSKAIGRGLGLKIKETDGSKGFYTSLTPTQRKFALKELSRFVGTGALIMIIAKLNSDEEDDVDIDPRSSGFGSVTIGNKKYNIFGRFSSAARTVVQVAGGVRVVKGKEVELGKKFGSKTSGGVVYGSFIRGKATPAAGLAADLILNNQKNYFTGEDIDFLTATKNLTVPLAIQDLKKDFTRDDVLTASATTIAKLYGANISDKRDFAKQKKVVTPISISEKTEESTSDNEISTSKED